MKKAEGKKEMDKGQNKIVITNGYLDRAIMRTPEGPQLTPLVKAIIKKSFTAKTSYWLARVFDEFPGKFKIYLSEQQKLIDKYAKRHDEDGAEREKDKDGNEVKGGKVIKSWKKGDMITDGQSVSLNNIQEFQREITELTEIEIEVGINKIDFDLDKEPSCTVEEMSLLLPLIEVKEV